MAEFCLACLNKLDGKNYDRSEVSLTHGVDLCEGCGEVKNLVKGIRHPCSPMRLVGKFLKEK